MSTTTSITAAPPTTMGEFLARFGAKVVTYKALNSMLEATHGEFIKALKAQTIRIAELEQRIKELESRPLLKYAGTWQSDATYAEGRLTTHGGGLWLAMHTTNLQPGTEASGWRLVVKRGRA